MKKALVVVDYQKDFVNGALGFEGADKIAEKILEKLKKYYDENNDIFFTMDSHEKNYLETQEGKNLPVAHCIKGTDGWKIYPLLEEYFKKAKAVIEKKSFGSLELGEILRSNKYEEIELCGLVSNICVISNAIIAKAALPEAKIIVDSKATDSFDKDMNEKTLDIMKGLQISIL